MADFASTTTSGSSSSKSSLSSRKPKAKSASSIFSQVVKKIDKDVRKTRKTVSKECNRILVGGFEKCSNCHKDIEKKKYKIGSGVYHRCCVPCRPQIICCICNTNITKQFENIANDERDTTQMEYCQVPIYCETYCKSHNPVLSCSVCSRKWSAVEKDRPRFTHLPDGRELCPSCSVNVIKDDNAVQNIYLQVVDFFASSLKLDIPSEMLCVPVTIVDSATLSGMSKGVNCCGGVLRGLTPSSIYRKVIDNSKPDISLLSLKVNENDGDKMLEEIRNVHGVFILDAMPEILCCSVIAHEAMHVWLKLNPGIPFDLSPCMEEGICQVVAYKYLEYVRDREPMMMPCNQSNVVDSEERELLRRYLCLQIEKEPSPIYGTGFRIVNSKGLDLVLSCLLNGDDDDDDEDVSGDNDDGDSDY